MRALPWILVGVGIGAVITAVFFNEPDAEYATGYDSVEDAARKTFGGERRRGSRGPRSRSKGRSKRESGESLATTKWPVRVR
jgi:hypothetical protein